MSKKTNLPNGDPLLNPLPQAGEEAKEEGAGFDLDEHHGMGGSYVVDPVTGKRVLQERTLEATASATESKE